MIVLTGVIWLIFWPLILLGWLLDKVGTAIGRAILCPAKGL